MSSNDMKRHFNCDPCLDRTRTHVVAILPSTDGEGDTGSSVHHNSNNSTSYSATDNENNAIYNQISLILQRLGRNMRVQLSLRRPKVSDMAQEVLSLFTASSSNEVDALIVSIPNEDVQQAVQLAMNEHGTPVFGVHEGYYRTLPSLISSNDRAITGISGYVAMDDMQAGETSGRELQDRLLARLPNPLLLSNGTSNATTTTVSFRLLVVSTDPLADTDQTYSDGTLPSYLRLKGLKSILHNITAPTNATVVELEFEELVVDDLNRDSQIQDALVSCPYDAVVLMRGRDRLLQSLLDAYEQHACSYAQQLLATFGTTPAIYQAMARKKLSFTVSHDQYLQANLVGTMAVLYATTGQSLVTTSVSSDGILGSSVFSMSSPFYATGARLVQQNGMPNDVEQICEARGFPECPLEGRTEPPLPDDDNERHGCPCKDRRELRIAGIYHDDRATAAQQAAYDLGVTLIMDRVRAVGNKAERMTQLAEKIKAYCQDRVDGVFTQVKHTVQAEAVRFCQDLNVPVFGVLPVIDETAPFLKRPIHTVGMDEYQAGYAVGRELLSRGMKHGYCVNWSGAKQLLPRCEGFEGAIRESDSAEYLGLIVGVSDNKELMNVNLEEAIGTVGGDNWDGVGLLMTGYKFVSGGLLAQQNHPGLMFGTEGRSDLVYQSLDDESLVATTDLQQGLRGYFPVAVLAWLAQSRQLLNTHFLPSGPKLIFEAPSQGEIQCVAKQFLACPPPVPQSKHQLDRIRPLGYAILAVILLVAFFSIGWVVVYRKTRIVRASQGPFLVAISAGCILMAVTIIPLSLDDGVLQEDGGCVGCECNGCDIACMVVPWLATTGFTIVFASLFSKIWRIRRLMEGAAKFRRLKLSVVDVLKPFAVLLTLNVAFNLVWTIVDPMYFERSQRCDSDENTSYGSCVIGSSAVSIAMASCLLAVNFFALLMANYQAYLGRNLLTEFSESRYIAFVMACILQVVLVGVPLMFLVTDSPAALFFVQTGIIAIVCLSILLLIFVPKMHIQRKQRLKREASDSERKKSRSIKFQNEPTRRNSTSTESISLERFGTSLGGSGLKIRKRKIQFSSLHLNNSSKRTGSNLSRMPSVPESVPLQAYSEEFQLSETTKATVEEKYSKQENDGDLGMVVCEMELVNEGEDEDESDQSGRGEEEREEREEPSPDEARDTTAEVTCNVKPKDENPALNDKMETDAAEEPDKNEQCQDPQPQPETAATKESSVEKSDTDEPRNDNPTDL